MNEQQAVQTIKMLTVLVEHFRDFFKMATNEIQWVIQNPKKAIALFIKAIKNRELKDFSIWKIINIGTGLNAGEFYQAITNAGGKVSRGAKDIIGKPAFTVSPDKAELNLVKVSVTELGFKGATSEEINERAISLGLRLVPAEAGPQLRLQYDNQPIGERLIMAMEPIEDSAGGLNVFNVRYDDEGHWLNTYYGSPGGVWDPGAIFVFAVCK